MSALVDPRSGETRIVQGGRAKAYRPLPEAERARALAAGLDAYERGDHFLAHELLEPAWMGTDAPAERDLYQGLIKLAAGYVHAARGNAAGTANNLRGARERLTRVPESEATRRGVDLRPLLAALERALARAEHLAAEQGALATGSRRRPIDLAAPRVRRTRTARGPIDEDPTA